MQVRTDSRNGAPVASPADTIEAFQVQTQSRSDQWTQQLQDDPDRFADIEQQIDQHYRQGGGQLVASLLAKVTSSPQMDEHIQQVRQNAAIPLRAPQPRTLKIRLLCGLMLWVTTAYCAPRRTKDADPSEQLVGLYPELAALGIGKGCSPALQYKVARLVALSPSIDVARKELRREGIVLDKKTVRRIAEQLGHQLLELRRRELFAWREGWLPAGNDFAGRRVAVQIDGGRVRLRENKKRKKNSKKKKGTRQKFDTPWREPKALIIFEFNEQRKDGEKGTPAADRRDAFGSGPPGGTGGVSSSSFGRGASGVGGVHLRRRALDLGPLGVDRAACGFGFVQDDTRVGLLSRGASHQPGVGGVRADGQCPTKDATVELRKLLKQSRYDEVVSELKKRAKRQEAAGGP